MLKRTFKLAIDFTLIIKLRSLFGIHKYTYSFDITLLRRFGWTPKKRIEFSTEQSMKWRERDGRRRGWGGWNRLKTKYLHSTSPLHTRKKCAEQWKEMWNLFEWLWIINKFQWFWFFFLPFHRHFGNEFCQKHVIISLSLSVSTRIECYAINIAFEMLSSQSRVLINFVSVAQLP